MKLIITLLLLEISLLHIYALCNWPTNLQNSVWVDSDKEALTFTTTRMSGLDFTDRYGVTTFDTWDCYFIEDYTSTSGNIVLMMKANTTFTVFSFLFQPFVCMQLTEVTQYSYYYYILGNEEYTFNNERLTIIDLDSANGLNQSTAEAKLCITGNTSTNEYHVLVKNASASSAAQDCPTMFQDEFWYLVNNGGTVSCNTQTEHWDVCTDRTKMVFNYTQCSTKLGYSSTGSVSCVVSITSGSQTLVTVWNNDESVSPPTSYRFTCFLAATESDGTISVSQSPKSCTKDQTPYDQPVHKDGTKGLNLVLTPYATSIMASTMSTAPTTNEATTTTVPTTVLTPASTTTDKPLSSTATQLKLNSMLLAVGMIHVPLAIHNII